MKCRKCGKEFIDFFSLVCPFCGFDNNLSFFDILFGRNETPKKSTPNKGKSDIYDWDNPDNCSDREYMDDDDYDDFDR